MDFFPSLKYMHNINPQYWGSSGWKFMHYITLAYPDNPTNEDKINIERFFTSVGNVLPCESCRINYYHHLEEYPLITKALSNRKSLVEWLMNIHNTVNKMHNKELYTVNKVYEEYMNPNQPLLSANKVLVALIIIFMILIFFYLRNRSL